MQCNASVATRQGRGAPAADCFHATGVGEAGTRAASDPVLFSSSLRHMLQALTHMPNGYGLRVKGCGNWAFAPIH